MEPIFNQAIGDESLLTIVFATILENVRCIPVKPGNRIKGNLVQRFVTYGFRLVPFVINCLAVHDQSVHTKNEDVKIILYIQKG